MKKFAKYLPIKARASLTEVERRVVRIEQKAASDALTRAEADALYAPAGSGGGGGSIDDALALQALL